jgi:hypothetical protein
MKKVVSVVCALFVTAAFAFVTLAADNAVKPAPTDNAAKAPEKKEAPKPAEKKY